MAYKVCSLATQFSGANTERIALLKQRFPNWRLHPFGGEITFDSNNGKKSITLYNDGEVRLEYKREHESTIFAWYGRNGNRRGVWRHIENKFAWINTCLGQQSFKVEYVRDSIRMDIESSRLSNDAWLFISTDWFEVADTKDKRVKVLVQELRFWSWRKAARKFVHWFRQKRRPKGRDSDNDVYEHRLYSLIPYTSETITSPDGIECTVLDTTQLNFTHASKARKSVETLVQEAKDGELIQTKNTKGQIESEYVTKPGDAIFTNPHNPDDRYVPATPRGGTRWQFSDLESKGYIIVSKDVDEGNALVKNANFFPVLHQAIFKPTCIKDAWGPGQHQFLFPGATLKLNDDGHVTGIDKSAFDKTWEIVSRRSM